LFVLGGEGQRERKRERNPQADSSLSMEHEGGLNPRTLRS